jgi:DegV family protein with EDD domain
MFVNVGKLSYLDGIDLTREEFYQRLPTFPEHPTTAVPSTERFRQAYAALAAEGASEVLSIHISTTLSAVLDVARLAAQEMTAVPVRVFDSQQLSLGSGFLVETAARMAAAGSPAAEILQVLQSQVERTHVFAALDTLEYLKRSGRMNGYLAGFATLLQVKPILTMHKGKPGTQRVRTRERALQRLVEMLAALGRLERVAILHSHASPEHLAELRRKAAYLLTEEDILTQDITPVLGVHIGPGAVGFAAIRAETGLD